MSAGQLTEKHFSDLFDAFNRHDIDAIMAFFADDCVFYTIGGEEVYGTRLEGKDAIAKAFSGVWAVMPDVKWDGHRHFVSGDRAVSNGPFAERMPTAHASRQKAAISSHSATARSSANRHSARTGLC